LLSNADGLQLAIGEEMSLVLADVFQAQPVGRSFEILRKFLDGPEVNTRGDLRHIATLEFFQHRLS
jgi:hypothetical protein